MMTQVDSSFDIPVVLIIFNRPAKLRQLWSRIELVKPSKLYVVSDGPRSAVDVPLVEDCRSAINPSWPCSVTRIFSDVNLGCRDRIVSGLNEVFRQEEMAIILEDDCIPDASFFAYCRQALSFYRNDPSVFSIAGSNTFADDCGDTGESSIFFSRYFSSWGWASWRRSWQSCNWDEVLNEEILSSLEKRTVNAWCMSFWKDLFWSVRSWRKLSWDYQFGFWGLRNGLSTVVPKQNLICNIGCDDEATHTTREFFGAAPASGQIQLPVKMPDSVVPCDSFDNLFELRHTDGRMIRRIRAKLALRQRILKLEKFLSRFKKTNKK